MYRLPRIFSRPGDRTSTNFLAASAEKYMPPWRWVPIVSTLVAIDSSKPFVTAWWHTFLICWFALLIVMFCFASPASPAQPQQYTHTKKKKWFEKEKCKSIF